MNKMVLHNGEKVFMLYNDICHNLGFTAEINFVSITRTGKISFTIGKPFEVKALLQSVQNKGFSASNKLIKAAQTC